jgi:hypothetical protein
MQLAQGFSSAWTRLQSYHADVLNTDARLWMFDILFLKKSLTSLALKSRTGTCCTAGALLVVADAGLVALPLAPQAFPEAAVVACGRPPSLEGVFAPELRSWG